MHEYSSTNIIGPSGSSHLPSPPSLFTLESAFQLQEYIAQLVRRDPEDVDTIVALPGSKSASGDGDGNYFPEDQGLITQQEAPTPEVDQNCWIYEHLRRLAQDLTHPLITSLQAECTRLSCPEMKAGEWLYLCVAHGNGGAMEVRNALFPEKKAGSLKDS